MLRLRALMALENVDSFQYLLYKLHKKDQIWPGKQIGHPHFFLMPACQGRKWPFKVLAYFDP